MSLDISKLTSEGGALLEAFVQKNGLDGAVIATRLL